MSKSCESPRVLIVGGAGGVGLACAEALAARGAELILSDCDGVALTRAAERLGAFSRYCDAIGTSSAELFAEELSGRFSGIDVLINAAGRGYVRALAMTRITRAVLPMLRRARGSRLIVNLESVGGLLPSDGMFPYASSAEAFETLSSMFKEELRGTGIAVITMIPTLSPGPANGRWSDHLYLLRRADELDTAERVLALVSQARPEWRQSPGDIARRA